MILPVKQSILPEGIGQAYAAAKKGLEESTQMKAERGRAAYYQDGSIGKQDSGATAGMLLIKGFTEYIEQMA